MADPEQASSDWAEMAVVGRIARAHGRHGEVIVNLETDFPEHRFHEGNVVYICRDGAAHAQRIRSARVHAGRPVVALEGVTTISEAEQLASQELRVPVDCLVELPAGSYYQHDLVGSDVRTVTGVHVGTVTDVVGVPGAQRLVVRPAGQTDQDEIDVPLAETICVSIDIASRAIVIDPPDGLLELNQRR